MRDPRSKIITLAAAVQWRSALRRDGKTLAVALQDLAGLTTLPRYSELLQLAIDADALLLLTTVSAENCLPLASLSFVAVVVPVPDKKQLAGHLLALNPELIDFTLASFRCYEEQQSDDVAARRPLPTESATAAPAAVRKEASFSELPSGTVCAVPTETAEATHAVSVQPLSTAAGGAS